MRRTDGPASFVKQDVHRPLRVAVFVSRFPIRSQTFVLRQITGLLERGCEVDIHPLRPATGEQLPDDFSTHDLLSRTRYPRHLDLPRWRRIFEELSGLAAMLAHHPFNTTRLLLAPHRSRRFREARRLLQTAAQVMRWGPYDVFHCHFGPVGVTAARIRRLVGGRALLTVVFHGYDVSRDSDIANFDYGMLFSEADALLPVSERWKERLLELGAPEQRLRIHRMGVDLQTWPLVRRPAGPQLRLLSVCRLVEKKGLTDAIEAVAILLRQGHSVRYTIVGDGPLLRTLRAQVELLGLDDAVDLIGWASPAEVRSRMFDSDVLLAPSVTASDGDQEGIPVSIMEAMATGLPVVATWHSGIPELVVDEDSGFLVPEHSPIDLSDRITRLATNPRRRAAMGESARQRVEYFHDQGFLDDQLVSLFVELK